MTNFFIDAEFYEDGESIEMISLAIVSGADNGQSHKNGGRYLYIENPAFEWAFVPAGHWLHKNVRPYLGTYGKAEMVRPGREAAVHIENFVMSELARNHSNDIRFWGYYCDYDWVLFCQQFGTMVALPNEFPKFCMDLKQWAVQLGSPILPPQDTIEHHALADARWNHEVHTYLHRIHWRDF